MAPRLCVRQDQETALHWVSQSSNDLLECCQLLLQAGADVHAATTVSWNGDKGG